MIASLARVICGYGLNSIRKALMCVYRVSAAGRSRYKKTRVSAVADSAFPKVETCRDTSQLCKYINYIYKLCLAVGAEDVDDLMHIEFLHLVAGGAEVFARIEFARFVGEDFADGSGHRET